MSSQLNPFNALDNVQSSYRSYVETFQNVDDETINAWIENRIQNGKVLWKEPFVQLNQRFQYGDALKDFVADGRLHEDILDVFTGADGEPIDPYKHQTEAIQSIQAGNNTIVSTGTGSGKSFAFGIPIVSHCLEAMEQGEDGIKAIIVYPMNALANSQYEDFAERLDGTGLKLGLYTGDTPSNPDSEQEFLQRFGRDESYDSELISREEIRETPPDILMTNYVMLDLILTRLIDKQLFPDSHEGTLQHLVLDEIHTYTGQQGADVAALVRRLREHTGVGDDLCCIGTSATVQSGEGLDADEEITDFASRIFGTDVSADAVVRESLYNIEFAGGRELPDTISVSESDITSFDGNLEDAITLTDQLTTADLDHVDSPEDLGEVLLGHPTVEFLQQELSDGSQQVVSEGETENVEDLVDAYRERLRSGVSRAGAERELTATLLAGTVATTEIQGEHQPIFVPKLHSFFSQGSNLVACLTNHTLNNSEPHLSDSGDIECRHCAERRDQNRRAFQLSFCRSCGQEYYTVFRSEEGHLESREVSDITPEDGEQAGYVMRGDWDSDEVQFPVQWLDDSGMLRDNWEEARPKPVMYCPEHNRLTPGHRRKGQLDCGCFGSQGVEATWVKAPFLFCAECGVHHSRRGRSMELSKMFQFGSVGRSTAMDVLVGSTLQNLPEGQQKTIAFSDNRQDTALQAAHINNLFQRIKFRRALYQAVKQATNGVGLTDIGDQIFDVLEEVDMIPEALPSDRFGTEPDAKRRYINYLLFQTLLDLRKSQQRGQQSLEEVGLIEVNYKRLSRFAALDDPWEGVPILEDAEPDVRREYVQGFLDLFRRASAVSHHHFTDFGDFKRENISKLPDETLFHKQQFFRLPQGFSDETDTSGTEKVRRLTHPRSRHVKWTTRSLDVDEDRAAEVIDAVVDLLSDPDELPLLEQQKIQHVGQAYMLKPDYIRIHPHDPTDVSVCPKCKTVVTRDNLGLCISYSCGSVVPEPGDLTDSYFHDLYTRRFGEAVEILAAEHSGQVEGDDRRELETRFREEDELNTIVCTPTMELGIDIGDLSSVFMRNVPPNPSNYSQRAGRAGRQNQPSVVSTFCGSGFGRQSHDQYFYQRPQRIISGEISPPTFLLDNEDLIRSHINSLVLEVIEQKLFGDINQILEINPEQNSYPVIESYLEDLEAAVAANEPAIINAVKSAFSRELASEDSYDWLTDDVIGSHVDGFVQRFDEAFDPWRQEYARLYRQRRRLSKKADVERLSYHESRERDAIEQRMDDMREGGQRFNTYQYLRSQGFLPNFGFPRSNCTLSFQTRKDDIPRDESRAIREFAPRNHVYYRGERYGVQYANPRTQDAEPITRSAIVCPACDTIIMGEEAEQAGACHICGESFSGTHPNPNVMALPDQRAMSEENITSDDEERKRKGYDIDSYYEQTDDATKYTLKSENVDDTAVTYEPSARIVTVNSGINSDDNEIDGFALCGECNRWLTSESQIENHLGEDGCYANADPENIERGIELYVEGNHDTITLTTPLPEDLQSEQKDEFYTTLREALYQGILVEFDLDQQEIESFTKPPTDPDTDNQRIIIHETSEGGAGALNALMDETRLSRAFEEAIDVLHGNDSDGCERACYDCLMSYYNQREHGLLNRHVVLPWFESRMSLTLDVEESRESTDGARYEQLKSACDSSLEIAVLDAIRDGGFDLPDEAQKIIYDGDEPIAKPDFYYEPSGRPIAVFVDGPDHEKQHIKADDRKKRNQLRQMNYRVVAVENPDNVADIWPLYRADT